jgi:hypothetical protein
MKRSLLSILLVLVATPLFAGPHFTVRDWNGAYSFHFDGIAFNTNGTFLANVSAIGQLVADGNGNFTSGSRSITIGNTTTEQTLTGTYTVKPDGTGHAVVTHQPGNLVQQFDIVLTDDGNEFNFNVTSHGIPNVFVVIQGEGKKQKLESER